jgi:hypothetical protein
MFFFIEVLTCQYAYLLILGKDFFEKNMFLSIKYLLQFMVK